MDTFLFYADTFSIALVSAVAYTGAIVLLFAHRYMRDDTHYTRFMCSAALLCCASLLMFVANHYMLFVLAWCMVQWFAVRMMIHNRFWQAAYVAGLYAARQFLVATLFLIIGFCMFYSVTGTTSIVDIFRLASIHNPSILAGVSCLFVAVVLQSAFWPFHRWLLSASHAPLPGYALINACTITSGLFMLVRFLPLYAPHVLCMHILFIVGLGTALIGMLFTALQTDRRRKLACSTMAQMGFIALWCSLGLGALAIAQICLHALFKAYCVLISPSAAQEKPAYVTTRHLLWALVCGISGSAVWMTMCGVSLENYSSNLFFAAVIVLALTELSLSFLLSNAWKNRIHACSIALFAAVCYAAITNLIVLCFGQYTVPQTVGVIQSIGFVCMVFVWLFLLFGEQLIRMHVTSPMIYYFYVTLVNASQPYATTITVTHSLYDRTSLGSFRKAQP